MNLPYLVRTYQSQVGDLPTDSLDMDISSVVDMFSSLFENFDGEITSDILAHLAYIGPPANGLMPLKRLQDPTNVSSY